jgi:hypothetical protein
MNTHALLLPLLDNGLSALAAQLGKAAAFVRDGGIDEAALVGARLAPDMFPLADQVRFTCHQADEAVTRLTGGDAAPPAPAEASLTGLAGQIAATRARVASADPVAIDADPEGPIMLTLPNDLVFDLTRATYVRDWVLPQFAFHSVAAYAILRHVGVPIGKPDFVPHMHAYLRAPAG